MNNKNEKYIQTDDLQKVYAIQKPHAIQHEYIHSKIGDIFW